MFAGWKKIRPSAVVSTREGEKNRGGFASYGIPGSKIFRDRCGIMGLRELLRKGRERV